MRGGCFSSAFFRAAVESVLVYGATTWTLTETLEKRLDGTYTRMLRVALNKSWKYHIFNKDLYLDIPSISDSIQKHRQRAGNQIKTYINQLLEDTGCNIDEIPTMMNDRKGWIERVKKFEEARPGKVSKVIHQVFT